MHHLYDDLVVFDLLCCMLSVADVLQTVRRRTFVSWCYELLSLIGGFTNCKRSDLCWLLCIRVLLSRHNSITSAQPLMNWLLHIVNACNTKYRLMSWLLHPVNVSSWHESSSIQHRQFIRVPFVFERCIDALTHVIPFYKLTIYQHFFNLQNSECQVFPLLVSLQGQISNRGNRTLQTPPFLQCQRHPMKL